VKVRDEDGQALVLALAFMIFFGLVIGVMLSFAAASVLSTARLREQRSTVYAADGATDAAIQVALRNTGVGAYGDPRCQASSPSKMGSPPTGDVVAVLLTTTATSTDATTANVICTWSQDQFQPERTVTFTTFAGGGSLPVVRATVLFHDTKNPVTARVLAWTYCGHSTSC
jgi:hypothetical protein